MIAYFYKISHKDKRRKLVYIGYTTNFTRRKAEHKYRVNNMDTDKSKVGKLYELIEKNGGWDKFNFELIETGNFRNSVEIRKRERELFNMIKCNMNVNDNKTTDSKIKCCCGLNVLRTNLKKHKTTKRHKDRMKNNNYS